MITRTNMGGMAVKGQTLPANPEKAMSMLIKSDRWNTNDAKIQENKIGEKHTNGKEKNLTLASMSSNSTMLPALGVTMADWIGKSCIEGIFSLARDVTTRGLISSFFRIIRKHLEIRQ